LVHGVGVQAVEEEDGIDLAVADSLADAFKSLQKFSKSKSVR